jgi:hypothetical protein
VLNDEPIFPAKVEESFQSTNKGAQSMEEHIAIYGHDDLEEFPTLGSFRQYIRWNIFHLQRGRYHHTVNFHVTIILLARGREIYGHFVTGGRVDLTPEDRDPEQGGYAAARAVYIVSESALYDTPVPMTDEEYRMKHIGIRISEPRFNEIRRQAGTALTTFYFPAE